ncbi:MAG TPA: AAA family ATPase [Ktedonobacterales bacterium]|jgi:hypothetical protein
MKRNTQAQEPPIPSNEDAEQQLIGAVMEDNAILRPVAGIEPVSFYRDRHQIIWRATLALSKRGEIASHDTLMHELQVTGKLEDAGGENELLNIRSAAYAVPHAHTDLGARGNARAVLETYRARKQIELATKVAAGGYGLRPETWDETAKLRAEIDAVHALLDSGDFSGKSGRATSPSLRILSAKSLIELTPAAGIIGNILYEDSIAYLFSDSDTWKTFLALSWGLCISTGTSWLGRTVKAGPVVYVAAEGGRGLAKRVQAWLIEHEVAAEDADFYTVPAEVNMLSDEETGRLVKDIRALLGERNPVAIFFDTLSRSMGGADENGAAEGNKVTSAANRLRTAFNGATVIILHHNGKDGARGMRGSSTYRNNADTVIQIKAPALPDGQRREPGSPVTLHSLKSKDQDNFADFTFTTQKVEWATDDGEKRNSLVVCASDAVPHAPPQPSGGLKDSERTALLALTPGKNANTEAWLAACGLVKSTFFTACGTLLLQKYTELVEVPGDRRRKWYRLTELGVKVQDRYKKGPTGPNGPIPDEREVGPDDGVGPTSGQEGAEPGNSGQKLGISSPTPPSVPGLNVPNSETSPGSEKLDTSSPTYLRGSGLNVPISDTTPPPAPPRGRWTTKQEEVAARV